MSIDADVAAAIAHELGLNLSDAAALAAMADDEGHARRIGTLFAGATAMEDPMAQRLAEKVPPRPTHDPTDPENAPGAGTHTPPAPRSGSAPPALPLNTDALENAVRQKVGLRPKGF